jgi:TetR/AcrR family transcriptional regulator, transcriptional repressor for nem operon
MVQVRDGAERSTDLDYLVHVQARIKLMAAEPRTARGRATRERILRAAGELIAERGVAGTSLDDVRERAHASKSQLYLYFADREELLRAVAETTCDAVLAGQAEVLDGFDSFEGIERYLAAVVAVQVEGGAHGGCPIGSLAGQLVEGDDVAREILAGGFKRWESGLRVGLEAMAARGDLRSGADPAALATQTLAILQGGLLLTQVRRDPAQMRTAADAALALIRAAG